MASENSGGSGGLPYPAVLVVSLWALAAVSVVLGVASGVSAALGTDAGDGAASAILRVAVRVAAGGCIAGVLWALGWLCRTRIEQVELTRRIASALEELAGAGVPGAAGAGTLGLVIQGTEDESEQAAGEVEGRAAGLGGEALLRQLRELNVNVLLSESQREMKRRYFAEPEGKRLSREIERLADAGDVARAEAAFERLIRLVPDHPALEDLRARLEEARAQAQSREIAEAGKRVEDLMSLSDFDAADAVLRPLLSKYPSASEVSALAERVAREREAFVKEQRLRLFQRVDKEAAARHWRSALSAAQELLKAYPGTPEADGVQAQLETIRENARIEQVREIRDRIGDLIGRRRFEEALKLAQHVILEYPDTAAADQLRGQLARLKELARSGGGPEA